MAADDRPAGAWPWALPRPSPGGLSAPPDRAGRRPEAEKLGGQGAADPSGRQAVRREGAFPGQAVVGDQRATVVDLPMR